MPMFEGDPLVLRCQAWQDWPLTQVTFYRDGAALGPPGPSRELPIAALRKADSGHYHCSAMFRGPGPGSLQMASPVAVAVQGERGGSVVVAGAAGERLRPHGLAGAGEVPDGVRGRVPPSQVTWPLRAPVIPTLCPADP